MRVFSLLAVGKTGGETIYRYLMIFIGFWTFAVE
jgi:hypothetical protein